jgi:endogenous inhibitor of DNA gyrase (YacG/DUF329 family)
MIRPIECPICHKPVPVPAGQDAGWFPFCSERCRQVDLLRWSKGRYAIVEPLRPEHLEDEENQNPND